MIQIFSWARIANLLLYLCTCYFSYFLFIVVYICFHCPWHIFLWFSLWSWFLDYFSFCILRHQNQKQKNKKYSKRLKYKSFNILNRITNLSQWILTVWLNCALNKCLQYLFAAHLLNHFALLQSHVIVVIFKVGLNLS